MAEVKSQYQHLSKTEREEVIEVAKGYTDDKIHNLLVGCKECGLPVIDRREFLEAHCFKFHNAKKYDECRHLFINID